MDLKGRKVGKEDLEGVIDALYDYEGDKKNEYLADECGDLLENALEITLDGEHGEGGEICQSVLEALDNTELARLTVTCRDRTQRTLGHVVSWYAKTHLRIAREVKETQEREYEESKSRRRRWCA
jgi:hypothetical protein